MKKSYRAIVVDDEERARKNLKNVLAQHPDVVVEAEAGDVPSALDCIREIQPDLIFLDIKMPGQDGFDLLEKISEEQLPLGEIIFLTAYDEFAIRAIKCAAFDYLLKPVDPEVLADTLDRFRSNGHQNLPDRLHILEDQLLLQDKRLRFVTQSGFAWYAPEQIVFIEAEGSYSRIHDDNDGKILVCRNLKSIEDQVNSLGFIRIHRGVLINTRYLVAFDRTKREVQLAVNGQRHTVPVSVRMMRNLSV